MSVTSTERRLDRARLSLFGGTQESGVTRLFLHSTTALRNFAQVLASAPGYEAYSERALLLARAQDVVCVNEPVDSGYLDLLAALGIGPSRQKIMVVPAPATAPPYQTLARMLLSNPGTLQSVAAQLTQSRRVFLSPYLATGADFILAKRLSGLLGIEVNVLGGNPTIVNTADQKDQVRTKAMELGIPVAEGEILTLPRRRDRAIGGPERLRAAIVRQLPKTGRVIIRGASGCWGSSTWAVDCEASMEAVVQEITKRRDNHVYLIEAMVEALTSPNIQMLIEPVTGRISLAAATDQRWQRPLVHGGNLFPSRARSLRLMIHHARKLCVWLRSEGYTGLAGFDFLEYRDSRSGDIRPLLSEVNPRINGATYTAGVVERLNRIQQAAGRPTISAFLSANIGTPLVTFEELRRRWSDLWFDPDTGRGIIPFKVTDLRLGKLGIVVCSGSTGEAEERYQDLVGTICP